MGVKMKNTIALLVILFSAAGIIYAADPVEGFWLSVDEKTGKVTAGWEIYQENGKLYGKVLSNPDVDTSVKADQCKESYKGFPVSGKVNQMPVAGTPWIFGLTMEKTGVWGNGNVVDPNDGNMYTCKITFHAADSKKFKTDTLEFRGSIGIFGRSQYWQKTTRETAAGLYKGK
jgi:uncharacterized protein (DUF2147 family)